MRFNPEQVRLNARQADTDDLLDRVTVFREGMEPEALGIIESELNSRGIRSQQIDEHGSRREKEVIFLSQGLAARCSFCRFCHKPAVKEGWAWHRLWGYLPVYPRYFYYCENHAPGERGNR